MEVAKVFVAPAPGFAYQRGKGDFTFRTAPPEKERAMGDRGGKKDKDKNKKLQIKKREDKAAKAKEKNQKQPAV